MAGNIKGIIVEIGGDTSGLQSALKKVNSATASLSKELKGINTMLKLDPKNTELLAQKQTVLRQKINETTKQLNLLKDAQKQYVESGGNLNSDKYRNLQREIIKTENELKNLKIESSNWTQASKSLSELSTKMTNFGDKVTDVGKKVSVLSAAVGSLFVAGTKYNADMEKYTTAFKTFLGSAEEAESVIENIKKQSETSPFETADLIKSNQMLITTGENAEDAQKTISALADAIALTGGGNDELTRMASNLQQIKNAGKATSMDIRQFAYAGIDVYGVLSKYTGKTTDEIKKMDITYEDLSKALQASAQEGGKYFNGQAQMAETLSGQVGKLKKSFKDLTGELSQSLYPTIKQGTDRLQKLVDWFKGLDDKTKSTITKIGLFVTALGPVLIGIGKFITIGGKIFGTLSKLTGIIAKVTSSAGGLSGVISALTGPIGIVVAAIAALVAAFVYFYNTNEEFRNKVNDVWNGICQMFTEQVMPILEELWNTISEVVKQIIAVVIDLWNKIEPIVLEMLNWLLDFWENTLKDIVVQVVEFVAKLVQFQAEIYSKFILPIMKFLMDTLWPVIEWIVKNVMANLSSTFDFIGKIVKNIIGIFNGIITFISGVFSGNWSKAWEGIKTIFKNIVGGLGELIKRPINTIIDSINSFIRGINKVQVPDWVPAVGGKGINIPEIPKLAKGGIVDQTTIAMIGEGKSAEAVIPLDKTLTKYMAEAMREAGGTRNITLNFYPQQMNEQELDRAFDYVERRFSLAY